MIVVEDHPTEQTPLKGAAAASRPQSPGDAAGPPPPYGVAIASSPPHSPTGSAGPWATGHRGPLLSTSHPHPHHGHHHPHHHHHHPHNAQSPHAAIDVQHGNGGPPMRRGPAPGERGRVLKRLFTAYVFALGILFLWSMFIGSLEQVVHGLVVRPSIHARDWVHEKLPFEVSVNRRVKGKKRHCHCTTVEEPGPTATSTHTYVSVTITSTTGMSMPTRALPIIYPFGDLPVEQRDGAKDAGPSETGS